MALTAKLHDTATAQRRTGTSPGWLTVDLLYLPSAHGSFTYAVRGLCTTFTLRRLSTFLCFQQGGTIKGCARLQAHFICLYLNLPAGTEQSVSWPMSFLLLQSCLLSSHSCSSMR